MRKIIILLITLLGFVVASENLTPAMKMIDFHTANTQIDNYDVVNSIIIFKEDKFEGLNLVKGTVLFIEPCLVFTQGLSMKQIKEITKKDGYVFVQITEPDYKTTQILLNK
jgi:hypothetical protein